MPAPSLILSRLRTHALEEGTRAAISSPHACSMGACMTYGALWQSIVAGSSRFRPFPDRSVIMLASPNCAEYVVAFLSVLASGHTIFPVHPQSSQREFADAARCSGAVAIVRPSSPSCERSELCLEEIDLAKFKPHGANGKTLADALGQLGWGDLLLQSSGTTGRPKIVHRTGSALNAVARNVARAVGLRRDDRVLTAIPLCHSYGVESGLLAPLLAGARILLCSGFDPATIMTGLAQGATVFPGVPFMFEALANLHEGPSSTLLRCAYSAGAALPRTTAARFRDRAGPPIGQLYGSTEIGSATFMDGSDPLLCEGTVGRPMDGVEILICTVDDPDPVRPLPLHTEGHVLVHAPSMLEGYVGEAAPFVGQRYFPTGDLGYLDDRGRLFLTGRTKLQIDIAGTKVNPMEIERILAEHPAVRECLVVPLAVSETVSRLKAIIVPQPDHASLDPESLRAFIKGRVAPHKVPRQFEIRSALPRSSTGKVLRRTVSAP